MSPAIDPPEAWAVDCPACGGTGEGIGTFECEYCEGGGLVTAADRRDYLDEYRDEP